MASGSDALVHKGFPCGDHLIGIPEPEKVIFHDVADRELFFIVLVANADITRRLNYGFLPRFETGGNAGPIGCETRISIPYRSLQGKK